MPLDSLGRSSSQMLKKTVKMCAVLRWVHISTCFWEKWISSSQSQSPKGPSRLSLPTEAKANVCHGMGVQQSKQHGWHMCEGTINMEAYTGIVQRHILPSRWWEVHGYYIKTMPSLILHVLQQRGFVDKVNVLDWPADLSPIENVWLIMKRRIRQQQSQTAELLKSCIKWDWTKILLAEL